MQPDFYSEEDAIVGKIFVHIGKTKKGQDYKLADDILKMLLLEKMQNRTYRKIIVVCDEEAQRKLAGTSVLAACIKQFAIEVRRIELEEDVRMLLTAAQARQKMTNA